MKNKKLITLCMSFLTTLGLVSCGATDSKVVNESPVETFLEPDIVSHGIKINKLATGTDANEHEYQTFSFVVVPSSSVHKDCTASISFADNRQNGSSYLTATVDNNGGTCTVTMLDYFDSVATLKLQNNYYSNVYAEVTIRLNPRYTIKCNSFDVETLYSSSGADTKINSYLAQNFYADMTVNTEESTNAYQNGFTVSRYVSDADTARDFNIIPSDLKMTSLSKWPGQYGAMVSWNGITSSIGKFILVDLINYALAHNHGFCFSSISDFAQFVSQVKQSYDDVNIPDYWAGFYLDYFVSSFEQLIASETRTVNNEQYGYFLNFDIDLSKVTWSMVFDNGHPLASASIDTTGICHMHFQIFQDVQSMTTELQSITF